VSGSDREAPRRGTVAPGRVKDLASTGNPIVKDLRALSSRKGREDSGLFLAEGLKLALDALDGGWDLRTLVVAKADLANPALARAAARARAAGADIVEASAKVMAAISRRDNPQNAIAVVRQRLVPLARIDLAGDGLLVALDRVRDPGNLGTIMRTADAVGAKGVALVGDCVDPFSLEAVRATMGSIFAVPVARASEDSFLDWRRRSFRGLVVGTHMRGTTDYRAPDYAGRPAVVLMGNEQAGLSDALAEGCDALVRIPQAGRADSLNLAVATGVMLFEARRKALSL
jgi:RNA methyltransferase, TrmH family